MNVGASANVGSGRGGGGTNRKNKQKAGQQLDLEVGSVKSYNWRTSITKKTIGRFI